MNLKKLFAGAVAVLVPLLTLSGCNSGGSSRGTPNTAYGQLVSGGSAPANPNFSNQTVIPMTSLNSAFTSLVVCGGLDPDFQSGIGYDLFCTANVDYMNAESMFGLGSGKEVGLFQNYVDAQALEAGVGAAKMDAIQYTTPGAPYLFAGHSTTNETVSGLVILPTDDLGVPIAESRIKGVVLYFHPTVLSKAGVPSGIGNAESTADESSTFISQFTLASIYTSAGFIVVAPDYVGQGVDTTVVHPYVLIPSTNAQSGIYMLSAVSNYLKESYNIDLSKINSTNGTPQPNLYISSYSEGGGYAMTATQMIQGSYANIVESAGLVLKRTVGVSGAYDLTNQMLPSAFDNITNGQTPETNPWSVSPGCESSANSFSNDVCGSSGLATESELGAAALFELAQSKPPLGAYMVNALVVYDYTPAAYNLVMVPQFAQQSSCVSPASFTESAFSDTDCANIPPQPPFNGTGGSYTVAQLFSSTGLTQSQIGTQLFYAAGANKYFLGDAVNAESLSVQLFAGEGNNSVGAFIYPNMLLDPTVMSLVAQANTYNWMTTTPVSLVYLRYDSTVTNLNSKSACGYLGTPGITGTAAASVTCTQVDNSNLWENVTVPGNPEAPIYLNHGAAEGITQMVALNQMLTNP